MGEMAEYYDDRYSDFDESDDTEGVVCKRCGRDGLEWNHNYLGWRLYEPVSGDLHECTKNNSQ